MNDRFEIIIRGVGKKLIKEYNSKKTILCGVNGPYDDKETKVRNLCHLIIITSIEYMISRDDTLVQVLKKMASDLINERNFNECYILRKKEGKDSCNGVIGHSWVIEAFVYLYKALDDENYLLISKELSEKHVFNYDFNLWSIPNSNAIDFTYNHQLWYAASLLELNNYIKDSRIQRELDCFFANLSKISLNSLDGKISHSIYYRTNFVEKIKQKIKKCVNIIMERTNNPSMKYKEEGYHLFNMMALARIYKINPSLNIFKTKFFINAIKYLNSETYLLDLEDSRIELDSSLKNNNITHDESKINIYGFSYNVPGFEIDYIDFVFGKIINKKNIEILKEKQIYYTYNEKNNSFGKNCHDKNTINYRTYEYYRYLELKNEKNM